MFKQSKKHIANFIIEFKTLAIKAETDDLHAIFLLKKNIKTDIIKIILEYPPIAAPETLKEWKVAITSKEQEYKSMENRQDYRIGSGTTYGKRGIYMNIRKAKDNFNKNKKPKCFNYNIYRYIVKNYRKPKKERDIRKCYKCDKIEHIANNCKIKQKMKNRSIQEESDEENNNK